MDSLTQIVLGASIGEAMLGKKLGNKAPLYGAIAGTIPDLDVFVGKLYDPITAITIHRGFSHSILFFLILSPRFRNPVTEMGIQKTTFFQTDNTFFGF
ncbi:metal-dependent hydrolase [Capnocytophaga canimorsus]|nr:metal-dependent hydrolase [Capnocytophaga canimorsus]WGU68133.1 metal-dependent hydrolase [Capnocytophaga canimorsus]WGU70765.1 metal-dependent hydrolase [Capnocytophaga canimorsus]